MKRIVAAGQKGGVGKSTVSRAVATGLALKRKKVILADLDYGQQTCGEWAKARAHNRIMPSIDVQVIDVEENGYHVKGAKKADFVVYDCPGWSDQQTVEAAKLADLVILPSGPSQDDLRPLIRLVDELVDEGVDRDRIAIVLIRTHTDAEVSAARNYLAMSDLKLEAVPGDIREGALVARAHGVGQTVLEVGSDKQKKAAATLVDALVRMAEAVGERKKPDDDATDWEALDWSVVQ